ncbi:MULTISPECIES: pirin family protein [Dyella]|uniref:Pirin family protein n=2 Tax=Dyella TaxID=231454 RepID=A0A4R0YLY0_9GAMM|nr:MULTISPECIES: pirin family protein [Dyella]TBR35975.1 pirin family protein [Dyella terrae]TCI08478.1 pirin family protein [Dyella soli]
MIQVRTSAERGLAEHGWLSSRHTFSFAEYFDPRHMGFGPLRVINEDQVQGGQGFGTHGHQNMEIISYVLGGALEHKDSMGTGSVLHYGDVQRMSAGTGVRHSEFNHDPNDPVHFLQIWIMPERNGVKPSYEEKHFDEASKRGQLRLIVSPDGRDGSLRMNQDALLYASILDGSDRVTRALAEGRLGYVHVARGSLTANGVVLKAGDALKLDGESEIVLDAAQDAEVLVFDLPR